MLKPRRLDLSAPSACSEATPTPRAGGGSPEDGQALQPVRVAERVAGEERPAWSEEQAAAAGRVPRGQQHLHVTIDLPWAAALQLPLRVPAAGRQAGGGGGSHRAGRGEPPARSASRQRAARARWPVEWQTAVATLSSVTGAGAEERGASRGALPRVRLQAVDDPRGAKVQRPLGMLPHVVSVRQEDIPGAAQLSDALR